MTHVPCPKCHTYDTRRTNEPPPADEYWCRECRHEFTPITRVVDHRFAGQYSVPVIHCPECGGVDHKAFPGESTWLACLDCSWRFRNPNKVR